MSNNKEHPHPSEQTELDALLMEGMTPIFPASPQLGRMSARLHARVAHSIAAHADLLTVRIKDGVWRKIKDGIRIKPLWQGPEGNSVLIEFAPDAALPVHRHNWAEEGMILRGGLQMENLDLGLFDYHCSPAGSRHGHIRSRQSALAYLRGTSIGHTPSMLREMMTGLLPFKGADSKTVNFNDSNWQQIAPGVLQKKLYSDGVFSSSFYRLEPGASVAGHFHPRDEECMMLEGELFLGDILLRAGEYQLAPAGTWHGESATDVGALLFVRGAAE